MLGKYKCDMLKEIRRRIAFSYHLTDLPPEKECDHRDDCPGYCPACDAELVIMMKKLQEKNIRITPRIAREIIERYLKVYEMKAYEQDMKLRNDMSEHRTMGIMAPNPYNFKEASKDSFESDILPDNREKSDHESQYDKFLKEFAKPKETDENDNG